MCGLCRNDPAFSVGVISVIEGRSSVSASLPAHTPWHSAPPVLSPFHKRVTLPGSFASSCLQSAPVTEGQGAGAALGEQSSWALDSILGSTAVVSQISVVRDKCGFACPRYVLSCARLRHHKS